MTKRVDELSARAEVAMMGRAVEVPNHNSLEENKADLEVMFNYIVKQTLGYDLDFEAFWETVQKYCQNLIRHIIVNKIEGMTCVTFTLETISGEDKAPYVKKLNTRDGVFSYVLNLDVDYFSEFGYVFFKKQTDGSFTRVG